MLAKRVDAWTVNKDITERENLILPVVMRLDNFDTASRRTHLLLGAEHG